MALISFVDFKLDLMLVSGPTRNAHTKFRSEKREREEHTSTWIPMNFKYLLSYF